MPTSFYEILSHLQFLANVFDKESRDLWHLSWFTTTQLSLSKQQADSWNGYTNNLIKNLKALNEDPNSLL